MSQPPLEPLHFIGEPITVTFERPPVVAKRPPCPRSFQWREQEYGVVEVLAEWKDYRRRGRMAHNMRPSHLEAARLRGSWGVGRAYFRVRVHTGQIFDIYYDRAPSGAGDREGSWFLLREMGLAGSDDSGEG